MATSSGALIAPVATVTSAGNVYPPSGVLLLHYSVASSALGGYRTTGTRAGSLGGYLSSTTVPQTQGQLFADLDADATASRQSEYVCVFAVNTSSDDYEDATMYFDSDTTAFDCSISVAADVTEAKPLYFSGDQSIRVESGYTSPPLQFVSPTSSEPLAIGTIPAMSTKALWLKRTPRGTSKGTADALTMVFAADVDSVGTEWEVSASWSTADATATPDCTYDYNRCDVFSSVTVNHVTRGNTQVSWTMRGDFIAPSPITYELQVGQSGIQDADDWTTIGSSTNVFTLTDPVQRAYGKQLTHHYRIVATDDDNVTYVSRPVPAVGGLSGRDLIFAQEILRKFMLAMQNFNGVPGYLIKRRRTGTVCTRCVDQYTNLTTDSRCPVCLGTRFVQGYFKPYPCAYFEPPLYVGDETIGMGEPVRTALALEGDSWFANVPLLSSYDVFVEAGNDKRYYLHNIRVPAQIRGVPILQKCQVMQAPFDDPIYDISLDQL